jgi:hypothetical protein
MDFGNTKYYNSKKRVITMRKGRGSQAGYAVMSGNKIVTRRPTIYYMMNGGAMRAITNANTARFPSALKFKVRKAPKKVAKKGNAAALKAAKRKTGPAVKRKYTRKPRPAVKRNYAHYNGFFAQQLRKAPASAKTNAKNNAQNKVNNKLANVPGVTPSAANAAANAAGAATATVVKPNSSNAKANNIANAAANGAISAVQALPLALRKNNNAVANAAAGGASQAANAAANGNSTPTAALHIGAAAGNAIANAAGNANSNAARNANSNAAGPVRNLNAIKAALNREPHMKIGNWLRYANGLGYNTAQYAENAQRAKNARNNVALTRLTKHIFSKVHPDKAKKDDELNRQIREMLFKNLGKTNMFKV